MKRIIKLVLVSSLLIMPVYSMSYIRVVSASSYGSVIRHDVSSMGSYSAAIQNLG
ncbi:hypothetical protein ACFPDQ_06805 [Pseudofrancisella aestuarii]|uniref:Uncharacterized protein n=1 Tax=Pseudofrancisella aestuarii TaxID=2670347 RepID=A0ABV9TDN9_9GAMM|nr:hypothetical protein [Pseudofrancisella aestuarii]